MESSSAAQIIEGVISYDSYGRRKDVTLLTLMWHGFCIGVTACDFQVLLKEDTPMRPVNTKDPLTVFPHNQFGLVWHLWPKSQNARLWLLSLKVALLRVSYTDTLDHHHTFPTTHAWNHHRKFWKQTLSVSDQISQHMGRETSRKHVGIPEVSSGFRIV